MQECVELKGVILKSEPIGEYDRRIVILTDKRGKISAFARGARKPNSRYVAGTGPFVFGQFKLFEGRNSYSLNDVEVLNYFDEFKSDMEAAYYGMYFLEVADYYTRENNDELMMLKLLYQSLRALLHDSMDNRLIKAVYEIKSTVVNGEFPGITAGLNVSESAMHAVKFITDSSIEKLYTFALKPDVLKELEMIASDTVKKVINHSFKSLEILNGLSVG
ncbi:MAG: DNA repair protein RecO [Lachnospiraceae bacterium]|nr:DNA repair protein RecO [Lachnospiraceae bacterium]